jgi:hypothetical protein
MDPIVWEGLLGIVANAAIVFAVLGGRVWRIPTVVTVGFLIIATVTFFTLAALTLKTHKMWRDLNRQREAELTKAMDEQKHLREGELVVDGEAPPAAEAPADPDAPPATDAEKAVAETDLLNRGNRQLRKILEGIREARGKTWYGTGKFTAPNADVTITDPNAAQITQNMPIYVFEDKEGKPEGVYIGAFKVTSVADKTVKLTLTETLPPEQIKRITGHDGNWILRSIMPVDGHDVFAGLTKEKIMELIPQKETGLDAAAYGKLIDEYVNDGKDVPGAPPERIFHEFKITKDTTLDAKTSKGVEKQTLKEGDLVTVNGTNAEMLAALKAADAQEVRKFYQRPLRNYEHTFRALNLQMQQMADRSAQVALQTAAVNAAIKSANEVRMVALEKEAAGLTADKAKMLSEQTVVKKYLAAVEKQQTEAMAALTKQYINNKNMAAELTKIQLDITKKLETQAAASRPSDAESAKN